MTFAPENVGEFVAIFKENSPKIKSFPGCERVDLLNDKLQTNVFFTYSIWHSEADLDNYRKSTLFGVVWKKTKALFLEPAAAWSLQNTDL